MSIKKVVVIGPESTGKSTLSEQLATALNTVCVPEYARIYLNQLGKPYNEDDLFLIAKGQIAEEERALEQANKFLICDTDLHVIKVWGQHKYNRCRREILEQIAERHYDLYLLTCIDMPWEDDPLREYPDPAMRQYFFQIYKNLVIHSGVPWALIEGPPTERLERALQVIQQQFPDVQGI